MKRESEEEYEYILRRLREESAEDEAKHAARVKNADLLAIALRHLDNATQNNEAALLDDDWFDKYSAAKAFVKWAKEEGLL